MTPAARNALQRAITASRAARLTLVDLESTASRALEEGIEGPLDDLPAAAAHRRAHRPGVPSKLATDPELQAFVLARIDTLTFSQITAEVAASFPPDRRISRSSLHRWWHRHGRHLANLNHL
ncbi:hypothetical protein [Pararhodobacter marinus]|uniref:hypothetical protein n=1 Tax=Pararhodobacter marinus TaxID=2184063 RepID=UPI003511E142